MAHNDLRKYIIKNEGFRKHPYRCTAGKLTIGYGRNLDDTGISRDEASYLLDRDLMTINLKLHKIKEYKTLDNRRQAVIIDMTYNMGYRGIVGFKKMWKAIKDKNYELAADEIIRSRYAQQLKNRASDNARIMLTGNL